MPEMTRRSVLLAGAGAAVAATAPKRARADSVRGWDVAVVGAGVFGAWTAKRLQDAGKRVVLIDAAGPANARASSGGESRMTRGAYGPDELYTRMAWESLPEWKALSARAGLPIFHPCGFLFLFPRDDPWLAQTLATYERVGLDYEVHGRAGVQARVPVIELGTDEVGMFDVEFGALMARRAVQTLVAEFVAAGGTYMPGSVAPAQTGEGRLAHLFLSDRPHPRSSTMPRPDMVEAEQYVFACGAWLPHLIPDVLGRRIFPTRQEIFFFAPPPGNSGFLPSAARGATGLPGWADFNGGDMYYGFPDLEARGFKVARDAHGPPIDPDSGDRIASAEGMEQVRSYMARRFPAMAGRPLNESRVCQYENSSNGDFLIDFHPRWPNALLVGAGSGHGFKHGPAVGRYAAERLLGTLSRIEPRFSLASKAEVQNRAVH
jgi:glycine/D-amino acid oxidase-like deaminating enzyme